MSPLLISLLITIDGTHSIGLSRTEAIPTNRIVTPGAVVVTHDGSTDPPGHKIEVTAFVLPPKSNVLVSFELRPFTNRDNKSRPIKCINNAHVDADGNWFKATKGKAPDSTGLVRAQFIVPYGSLTLQPGHRTIFYQVTFLVNGERQCAMASDLAILDITDNLRTEMSPTTLADTPSPTICDSPKSPPQIKAAVPIKGEFKLVPNGQMGPMQQSALTGDKPYAVIPYATTRMPDPRDGMPRKFTADPGPLCFGTARVEINPRVLYAKGNKALFFSLLGRRSATITIYNRFSKETFDELVFGQNTKDDVLLYIHGINNTFEDAATGLATIVYKLQFYGTPLLFSWPTTPVQIAPTPASYKADIATAINSGQIMHGLLVDLINRKAKRRLHIIAHSMGSRVLLEALARGLPPKGIDTLVIAAGEAPIRDFLAGLQPSLAAANTWILYSSTQDAALKSAIGVHFLQGRGFEPIGQSPFKIGLSGITPLSFQQIDCTILNASMLGHSYLWEHDAVLYDVNGALRPTPPDRQPRILRSSKQEQIDCWTFP